MKTIKELEKGCGTKIGLVSFCGVESNTKTKRWSRKNIIRYCPKCKAKLKTLQEVCEKIKKMPVHKREIKQGKESSIIINSIDKEELLNKLQGKKE